jgi:hypothetical protein
MAVRAGSSRSGARASGCPLTAAAWDEEERCAGRPHGGSFDSAAAHGTGERAAGRVYSPLMRLLRSRTFWLWAVYVAMMGVLAVSAIRDGDWWLLVIGGIVGLVWAIAEDLLSRRQGSRTS